MPLKPGMVVADIGTGTGYMLPFLSVAVGAQGRVLSEDIFPDFLEKAKNTAKQHKLSNVEFIQGTETDPGLPENGADVGLAPDSYHPWNYPDKMLAALHPDRPNRRRTGSTSQLPATARAVRRRRTPSKRANPITRSPWSRLARWRS